MPKNKPTLSLFCLVSVFAPFRSISGLEREGRLAEKHKKAGLFEPPSRVDFTPLPPAPNPAKTRATLSPYDCLSSFASTVVR